MKGKRIFSESEINKIRELIRQKLLASKNDQKKIRNKIRKIGFYFSDFSDKKGYNVEDFDQLLNKGIIEISDKNKNNFNRKKDNKISNHSNNNSLNSDYENTLMSENNFKDIKELDKKILNKKGLYCFRLKKNSKLPERYQKILEKRDNLIIYIGKSEDQILKDRLAQELFHKKPGTFFRSIGCVLGYLPIKGHLSGKSNKNNFKFSKEDTSKIINWLKNNIKISIIEYVNDFEFEKKLIKKYKPLLNYNHNPLKLNELKEDKEICREWARK